MINSSAPSPIIPPNIKTFNPEVIELTDNDDDSTMTNSSNLLDLMLQSGNGNKQGTSTKTSGSKDSANNPSSEVVIVLTKPAVGSTDSDTDMGDGKYGTSTNPSDYDCDVLTLPKSAVGSKDSGDNAQSGEAMIDSTKRSVGFKGITAAAVMVGDDLINNNDDEKMTDIQQQAKENTTTNNRKYSLQLAVLNKSIIPIWKYCQHKTCTIAVSTISDIF